MIFFDFFDFFFYFHFSSREKKKRGRGGAVWINEKAPLVFTGCGFYKNDKNWTKMNKNEHGNWRKRGEFLFLFCCTIIPYVLYAFKYSRVHG